MLDNFPSYLDKYPRHIQILSNSDNIKVSDIAKNLMDNLESYISNSISFADFKIETEFSVLENDIQDLKSLYYMRSRLIELIQNQGNSNGTA